MANIAMTDEEFEKKIKTISDKELQNRINQSDRTSNTYLMLIKESRNRLFQEIYVACWKEVLSYDVETTKVLITPMLGLTTEGGKQWLI